MAISIATGVFTKPAAGTTGNVAAAGVSVPFQPKALYLWSVGRLANATFETSRHFCQGVACADGTQGCHGTNGLEGGSGGVTGCSFYTHDAQVMAFTYNDLFGPHVLVTASFTSFDNLGGGNWGFTLNWLTNSTYGAMRIHYLLIGGSSITNATVKNWTSGEVPGTHAITGVGFKPDFLLGVGGQQTVNGVGNGAPASLFVANCQLEQWCVTNCDNTFAVEPSFPIRSLRQQSTTYGSITLGFLAGITGYARFTSFDADGWTTTTDVLAGQSAEWYTICLKGIGSKIGSVTKRTSTGPQTISLSPMATPAALLLASYQAPASAAVEDIARIGVGVYDGTNQGAVAAISPTATLTGYGGYDSNAAAFVKINNTSGTVDAVAAGLSLTTAGATLNWTTNDSEATELLYCALNDSSIGTCSQSLPSETPTVAVNFECVPHILCPEEEEP